MLEAAVGSPPKKALEDGDLYSPGRGSTERLK
jgi:hypothetical protein